MKKNKNFILMLIAIASVVLFIISWFISEPAKVIIGVIGATLLFVAGILYWITGTKKATTPKLLVLIAVYLALLSWIVPAAQANGTELVSLDIQRMSIYNFFEYFLVGIQNFFPLILFILAVGGLYGVLSETGKYRNKLEKIAKSLKGKEIVFLVAVSFVLAAVNSITGLNFILFIILPLIASIVLLMGYDKITALLTAFISPLIGVIGSTYGSEVTGLINNYLGTDFTTEIIAKIALFVLTFLVYTMFLVNHAKKVKEKDSKVSEEELSFIGEKKQSKKPSWPIFVVMGLLIVLTILGCTSWSEVFEITYFTDLHTTLTEWAPFDFPIINHLINGIGAFGTWSYSQMIVLTLMASIILSLVYNIKFDDAIEAYGKGIKHTLKVAGGLSLVYVILVITVLHPYMLTIIDWLVGLISSVSGVAGDILNILFNSISVILGLMSHVDLTFMFNTPMYSSVIPYLNALYTDGTNIIAIMTQSLYGLVSMFSPTSLFLIIGLGYLGVSYKEWIKSSWKLLVELLVIILIVIFVVAFL